MVADIQKLQKHFQDNPRRHHILSCCSSDAVGQDPPDEPLTEDSKVQAACDYFSCFNKAFQSARAAKRIDDTPLRPHADRASAQSNETRLTQWMRAQIDVYEAIIDSVARIEDLDTSDEHYHPVADVGQSSHRGAVALQGTVPSVSTSSRIYSYKLKRRWPQQSIHLKLNDLFFFSESDVCSGSLVHPN